MLKIALLIVMVTTIAQVFPSCGGEENFQVVGWVEAKRVDQTAHMFLVIINSTEYDVPGYFWSQVEVGDLVKWDGQTWTIVRKRGQPPG